MDHVASDRRMEVLERLHAAERDALLELKAALQREFGGDFLRLVLFGSRARGEGCAWAECPEHNPEGSDNLSDLDVVVWIRSGGSDWENWNRVIHAGGRAGGDHRVVFDSKTTDPAGWADGLDRELLFYQDVEEEGIEI